MTQTKEDLLAELLAKPVGPTVAPRKRSDGDVTRRLSVSGATAVAEVIDTPGRTAPDSAVDILRDEGLSPDEWEVSGFRKSRWQSANGRELEAARFSFVRTRPEATEARLPLDELVAKVKRHRPRKTRAEGDHGLVVALGDMQFGKGLDGDGDPGSLMRTITALNAAADAIPFYRKRYDIGHIHVAWLGDHIEGFVSQGGSNVWRTSLTLNEQIRLTRQVMLHALTTFAPLAGRVSMAAVPGNHGEAVRVNGKGQTRYDDSHDTEALIAVHDAAQMNTEAFGHVEFQVPETDELTVVTDVANTRIAHAHGHQWRPGKHMDWWRGQSFRQGSPLRDADVLLAGHLHHEFVEAWDWRTFCQVPAMESESTWYRHSKGPAGAPGLLLGIVKDGLMPIKEIVRD